MNKILAFIIIIVLSSCASEKFSVSPISGNFNSTGGTNTRTIDENFKNTINTNLNASEITNLIATFPKFKNDAINAEVRILKDRLQNYLYAYEAYNVMGKERELKNFEKSYKKIQKLRKFLNQDEDQVLNRYLVRLKTNLMQLENIDSKRP